MSAAPIGVDLDQCSMYLSIGRMVLDGDSKRVLIAEDLDLLARGLARLLRSFGLVVEVAATVREAVAVMDRAPLAGALVDFSLADGAATQVLATFRRRFPAATLVVMSGGDASEVSAVALKYDAQFIAKPFHDPAWLKHFGARVTAHRPKLGSMVEALEARGCTRREAEVFELYCADRTADEVGVALGISTPTVRSHLNKACARFGVKNVTAVLRLMFRDVGMSRH